MTKLFIATPAFDGKVNVQYAISLADTKLLLAAEGIDMQVTINSSGSLLVAERNRLNKAFLASDCTHMLCIDSDLGWPPIAVKAMLDHDVDFVGGLYPARGKEKIFLFRPECNADSSVVRHQDKPLLKMQYLPAGFMLIRRHVLETMIDKFSHLYFEPKRTDLKNENGYCLFDTEVRDGEFWGEDYVFCRRVRECGYDLWIDPVIQFDHDGNIGMFAEMLSDTKGG